MINGNTLRDAIVSAAHVIASQKQKVDELNVFPVPDGDTGTNMSMTIGASVRELSRLRDPSVEETAKVAASALLVGAVLPEAGAFPATAVSCCLASMAGAMTCVRRSPWGSLPSAMTCAGGFLLVLIAVALLCWQQITWLGQGGVLLLCGAGGGLLAGLLGGRRRKRKRRPVRKVRKA